MNSNRAANSVTKHATSYAIDDSLGICLIEDDEIMRQSLCQRFSLEGIKTKSYSSLEAGMAALKTLDFYLLICDVRLPDGDCSQLYNEFCAQGHILPPTIFITGYPDLQQAVSLLKKGASDYISKPFDVNNLLLKIYSLAPSLKQQNNKEKYLSPQLGISRAMQNIQHIISRVSDHSATVLISGESGVGKEYVARYLHRCSHGENKPFLALNCAALPDSLMESELFGYEKGAFTGAEKNKPGLIELAEGGTLLLDEVAEMSMVMQAKLLRVLQERVLYHLGGCKEISVNIDLISATNRDLRKMVEMGTFREDLYYRLHIVHIDVPPLRERPEDIIWFAKNKIKQEDQRYSVSHILSPATEQYLISQPWLGNVRELMNSIERALIFSNNRIIYPCDFESIKLSSEMVFGQTGHQGLKDYLAGSERWYIIHALKECHWQMTDSAALLQISRKNLWERMNRLSIKKEEYQVNS